MTKDLQGEFILDKYLSKLKDRLALYYKQTPKNMDNKQALKHWLEFKDWAKNHGYTQEEINSAKKSITALYPQGDY